MSVFISCPVGQGTLRTPVDLKSVSEKILIQAADKIVQFYFERLTNPQQGGHRNRR